MPEANGLKQVLYGDPDDDVAPVPDDVAPVPDDVAFSTIVDQEQELEEPSSVQVDHNEKRESTELRDTDTVENGPNEKINTEDGEKEDKFVDFSDELNVSASSGAVIIDEAKQISDENDDTYEAQVHELVSDNMDLVTAEDTKQNLKDENDTKEAKGRELDNGTQEEVMVYSPKESKDENDSLRKEFANLRHQLKALSSQKPYNNENEETEGIEKILSMHDIANECFKLVKNAVEEKLHIEEEFDKLQLSLLAKDQEIDHLNVKISEQSVCQSNILTFFNSQHKSSFDLSNSSTEVQNGLQSIDDSINRMIASLSSMVNADGFSDESITGKLSFLEQNFSHLLGNYQGLFSENEFLNRREVESGQHIHNLEEENKRVYADIEKIREELGEEKIRYANTKEKLSMAVTKGKTLVQQKDSLKQSLAGKTIEIEKYLAEVSQRDSILSKCKEILYQNSVNHELESADIMEGIRSLVDEKNTMAGVMMEYSKLEYVLSSIDFPEDVSSSDIESRVSWLVESFTISKGEMGELQDEVARSSEVLRDKIESLTISLLDETQEKNFIREELERLKHKYQEIVERESQLSVEKDRIVSLLLEASGTAIDERDEAHMDLLIDRCISKIKSCNSLSHNSSDPGAADFENLQTNLYLKDQELMLCKELLEKDTQMRFKVNTLENELHNVSQELQVLKEEKSAIERDFKHSDEKTSLLREKLSMAVKKGKGLAQDRENLKKLVDEKDIEIEKLKLELQQQESALNDFRNQIDKLSANLELIPKLEVDLNAMKDQKDQVEQFLLESNNMIEKVMESIDGVAFPVDATSEEPIGKVLWLVRYLDECRDEKTLMEKEFNNLKVEFDSLSSKLTEAYTAKSSLEEAITTAENSILQLREENSKLSEGCVIRKLLEDELSEAQNKISILINEKDEALLRKAAIETELEKVKEEVCTQTSTLADAYQTINSLKDALSHLETKVSFLSKENNDCQVHKSNMVDEMNKLKEEAESQSSKYLDTTSTIRLLENNLSKLDEEKKLAEKEILLLNSKLNVCMEELSGLGVSSENRSMELFGHLNNLQLLLKDETLSSLLKESFEVKFQRLRDMDFLLRDINGNLVQLGSDSLPSSTSKEEDYFVNFTSAGLDNFASGEIDKGTGKSEGGDSFESHFRNAVKGMRSRNKEFSDKVRQFSSLMDDFFASLLKNLQLTRDEIVHKLDQVRSLTEKVNDLETGRDTQKLALTTLENNVKVLLSACTVTAQELENEVENYEVELSSVPELKKWTDLLFEVREVKPAENLLMAAQKVCALTRQLERERNDSVDAIKDLENKMTETKATAENALEERDLLQARIFKLEDDLEVLRSSHEEMSTKVEEYQAKETTLGGREAEISSLRRSLVTKEREAEDALLVVSQIKYLYEKINDLENLFPEVNMRETETHDSDHLEKLSRIIDAVSSMQQQMSILSQDKEKLEANVVKQAHQIENLEEKIYDQGREKELFEKMKTEMSEVELGIKNIFYRLGGKNLAGDQKSDGVRGIFVVLEKLVTEILLDYDNTKSRAQEIGVKLHESQKVVDELVGKIKSFETSQVRSPSIDGLEDRSILEAPHLPTRSEITELEDVGSIGKKAKGSSPSAPHARPLRKGSTDHLAINIDSESDRLIKDDENDEDKGKVFKSLNTSGLIPVQGKMLADRVDGFWVSGDRALMSRPRVRLGLIAYWLLLHIWLLGTIL